MSDFKSSIEIQNIILKDLMPNCIIIDDLYSHYDCTLETENTFYIIEFKRRNFNLNKYPTLMLEVTKANNLFKARNELSKTISKPIVILYLNVLDDAVISFNLDKILLLIKERSSLVKYEEFGCNRTTADDLKGSGVKVNKKLLMINLKAGKYKLYDAKSKLML